MELRMITSGGTWTLDPAGGKVSSTNCFGHKSIVNNFISQRLAKGMGHIMGFHVFLKID